jgi:hypothetical protein
MAATGRLGDDDVGLLELHGARQDDVHRVAGLPGREDHPIDLELHHLVDVRDRDQLL